MFVQKTNVFQPGIFYHLRLLFVGLFFSEMVNTSNRAKTKMIILNSSWRREVGQKQKSKFEFIRCIYRRGQG